jgi:NMD protein affecting ribosome stability and mRNA decay
MKSDRGGFRMLRREQLLEEVEHDPLKPAGKLRAPTRCPQCGAVFRRGRWSWAAAPEVARAALCPACRRIRQHLPAGLVRLEGAFFQEHRDEILRRVRRCEAAQKRTHPLQRIMALEAKGQGMLVNTTDPHLARRIGDALHDAYKGALRYRYAKGDKLLRVTWNR